MSKSKFEKNFIFAILALVFLFGNNCKAEERNAAVKTNLLYDALLNVNLGAELKLAPHWSVDLSGNYNGRSLSNEHRYDEAEAWFNRARSRGVEEATQALHELKTKITK